MVVIVSAKERVLGSRVSEGHSKVTSDGCLLLLNTQFGVSLLKHNLQCAHTHTDK